MEVDDYIYEQSDVHHTIVIIFISENSKNQEESDAMHP